MNSSRLRYSLLLVLLLLISAACNLPGLPNDSTATPEPAPPLPQETEPVIAAETEPAETQAPLPEEENQPTGCRIAYAVAADIFCFTPGETPLALGSLPAPVVELKISGDGALLAILLQTDVEAYELWVAPTDASAPARMLVNSAALARPDSPYTYSPVRPIWRGGTHEIYFTSYTGGLEGPGERANYDLWKVNADSAALTALLPDYSGLVFPSPDGSLLALSLPESIELRNADGGSPQTLLTYPFIITYSEYAYKPDLVWAPDSSAFTTGVPSEDPAAPDSSINFHRFGRDGAAAPLGSLVGNFVYGVRPRVTLSPDGQHLIYGVVVSDQTSLHLARTNGTMNTIVNTYTDMVLWNAWSPDSSQYAFSMESGGGFVARLSEPPQPFFPPDLRVVAGVWLDTTALVYTGISGSVWALYLHPLGASAQPILEGLSEEPVFAIH